MKGYFKIRIWPVLLLAGLSLFACAYSGAQSAPGYVSVTAEEAKEIMDTEEGYVILDVRTKEEFDAGHLPGAILIPDHDVKNRAEEILPDKNQLILVYCLGGRRSKRAAADLVELGYTNVIEFGGIRDWPYETVR